MLILYNPIEGPFLISCSITTAKDKGKKETGDIDSQGDKQNKTDDDTQGSLKRYTASTQTKNQKAIRKERDVYWCVDKEDNTVRSTTSPADASPFHVIPTGDSINLSEFFLVHWQGNRQLLTNLNDILARSRANLPLYLTTNTGIFGQSDGPLQLKSTVVANKARFCLNLQSSAIYVCLHDVSLHTG